VNDIERKKNMKKIIALVLVAVMIMAMGSVALAAPQSNNHTITITNTDQNVAHTYVAYKVFSGNLNEDETLLSDIQWADGVDATSLLAALKASTDSGLVAAAAGKDALGNDITAGTNLFTNCTTAQDVAKVLETFSSTSGVNESAGAIDAVATIIADNLGTAVGTFTASGTSYTLDVTGDGYYFIKDTTSTLNNAETGNSDTLSKYLLSVIKNTTIVAKDTGLNPDKKILGENDAKVAADSSAIGDIVNFEVTVTVPNTKKYEDHFWFVMNDTLPEGITFTGITSVKIGNETLTAVDKASPAPDLTDANYNGSAGYYTLAVKNADNSANNRAWEANGYDAVKEAGGQAIELTFNQFKKFVEAKNLIGQTVTVKYTGVVNDDAAYEATANENEVSFKYSNNPNHDYDGDNPGPEDDDVVGTTPEKKTRTYTTSLKILKVDENGDPLAGATFELKGTALNRTVLTGTMFVEESYEPKNGETIDATASYWKLLDGSYTTTNPATVTNNTQYESTEKKYYKVTYDKDEVSTKNTDIVVVTDSNGVAEFVGLNEGNDYTLEEIAAPDGYNKIDGKANITITWSDPEAMADGTTGKDQGGFTLTATGDAAFSTAIQWNGTDKQFEVKIQNNKGTQLPSTGGIGTTIFYILGGLLVIGAGVVLVSRRRMSVEK
jgi:fimbrial isopeptide formation D2 family protein/LPXTG-motif cell wall-anchored protein